jgi:hypothetical protein
MIYGVFSREDVGKHGAMLQQNRLPLFAFKKISARSSCSSWPLPGLVFAADVVDATVRRSRDASAEYVAASLNIFSFP